MSEQPKWELIANLGDANPLNYGGYFVYRDTTGVYTEEAEKLFIDDDCGNFTYTIYRIILDRCEQVTKDGKIYLVPFGFPARTDLPYPIEQYDEWFNDDLDRVASFVGRSAELLRSELCSPSATIRALAYEAIGDYHGYDNLDSYPLVFTKRTEVESRYAHKNAVQS